MRGVKELKETHLMKYLLPIIPELNRGS